LKKAVLFLAAISHCFFALVAPRASHAAEAATASDEIVVASYNLENYIRMDRREGNEHLKNAPKPEKEINALIRVITDINPDILGVCEMGTRDLFDDFKTRLKNAGLGYTDFEYVDGPDPQRHLALVSRFPITSRQSIPNASYELNGQQEKVRRGFLDVTVKINSDYELRLVGAHLKSKLNDVAEGEALVRRSESHLLREHIDEILSKKPDAKLIVYGDFNDTKNEPVIEEIMGTRNSPAHLTDLWLRDKAGDHWTEYWKAADVYSRIDFIFVNRALLPDVVQSKSSVYRSEYWNEASDHRPVVATIRVAGNKQ